MKTPLLFLSLLILITAAYASPDADVIQQVKDMILAEEEDNAPRSKGMDGIPEADMVMYEEAAGGTSFKEDTLAFLMAQGYTQKEALDILNVATISAVGHMIAYENKSPQELQNYLSAKGYTQQEIDAVMEETNIELIKEAFRRGMTPADINKGFAERGFSEEEIQAIQRIIVVEQAKKALSEGMTPAEIKSTLSERGFTSQEIDEIMAAAGYQPERSLRTTLYVFAALLLILLAAAIVLWKKKTAKKNGAGDGSRDAEMSRLLDEKGRVEEMIELAKTKYHMRALDEESFREIIRDHQKKLIEIEAKIKHLDSRIQKLEEKSP